MRVRALAAFALVTGCAGGTSAQSVTSDSTITFTLSATDFGGNNNGVVESGESALLTLDVRFSNQNEIASFSPPIGGGGWPIFNSGTIRGLGDGLIDLVGSDGAEGMWEVDPYANPAMGVDPTWDIAGREGTPLNGGGTLSDIELGQFPANPSLIITQNPVLAIWRGLWTPASFDARMVRFDIAGHEGPRYCAAVVVRLLPTLPAHIFVDPEHLEFGSVQIQVAPSPAAGVPLFVLAFARRRKSRTQA